MLDGVRYEKSQDESCEPGQEEGGGVLFKCHIAIMRVALRPRLVFGLGCPLPFWDLLTWVRQQRETSSSVFSQCSWGLWNLLASAEKAPHHQRRSEHANKKTPPAFELPRFVTDGSWNSSGALSQAQI